MGVIMVPTKCRSGCNLLGLLLGMLLLTWGGAGAQADDGEQALETRIFRVGALTMGKVQFGGEVMPPSLPGSHDDENPLFGFEGEEAFYPVGQVDELIELCKGAVQPATWEQVRGADLSSIDEHLLVGRGPASTLDEIAAYLATQERAVLRSVRFEVQTVRLEPGQAAPREQRAIDALLRSPAAGPQLMLVAFERQRVSAMSGRQLAYVGDYDTSVAQESTISDPMVGVANLGLLVDVRAEPRGKDGQWLAHTWLRLADLQSMRTITAGEGRSLEVPAFATAALHTMAQLDAGKWTLAGASGAWAFYLRARPLPYAPDSGASANLPAFGPPRGAFVLRMVGLEDLATAPLWSIANEPYHLMPSAFTPPESPELREPAPYLSPSMLVSLLRHMGGRSRWEDPTTMEVRNGQMIVRADEGTHAGIAATLAALRRQLVWRLETHVELVDAPTDFAAALTAAPSLDGPLAAALKTARREGQVHTVAQATVSHRRMTRTTTQEGSHQLYLQDYAAELAQDAAIGNPIVMSLFSGLTVDLMANLTNRGDAAALEVRFAHTRLHEPMRSLQTPLGPIELPELDVIRVRTSLVAPLGKTLAFAAAGDGGRRRVLLLTPRLVEGR